MQFNITEVTGKGIGCIANVDFPPGKSIHREDPLIVIEGDYGVYSLKPGILSSKFKGLSAEEKTAFVALSKSCGISETCLGQLCTPEEAPLLDIISTNGFKKDMCDVYPMKKNQQGKCTAVYQTISRFNHSCYPNAVFCDHEVRSIRDIKEGDEITISYLAQSKLRSYSERQRELQQGFGFTCTCRLCAAEEEVKRKNDVQMGVIKARLSTTKKFEDSIFLNPFCNHKELLASRGEVILQQINAIVAILEDSSGPVLLKAQCLTSYFDFKCSEILILMLLEKFKVLLPSSYKDIRIHSKTKKLRDEAISFGTYYEHLVATLTNELKQINMMF